MEIIALLLFRSYDCSYVESELVEYCDIIFVVCKRIYYATLLHMPLLTAGRTCIDTRELGRY